MPGARDEDLLRSALTLGATARLDESGVDETVGITNDKTGNHVPTDSPLRQLILLVEAVDAAGQPLVQLSGPTVPEWGGIGDPAQGYYAGLPGKAYGKVLQEMWTGISPSGAYWSPTRVLSDNRLAAGATDTSRYLFRASPGATTTVRVTLLYRRAYKALMDQKGWDTPDIIMEQWEMALR